MLYKLKALLKKIMALSILQYLFIIYLSIQYLHDYMYIFYVILL